MAILPSGYTQLEYIESMGTQYIDTGFKPKYNTRVVMDVEPTMVSSWSALFGCRNQASSTASLAYLGACPNSTQIRSDYYGNSQVANVTTVLTRFIVDKNSNVFTALEQTITNTSSSASSQLNMLLMALNNMGRPYYYLKGKLYSCKIYDNGTLVRDFIPCKNPSDIIGLYDLVYTTFYPNAGTGTFIAGPEIAQPNMYVKISNVWQPVTGVYTKTNNTW